MSSKKMFKNFLILQLNKKINKNFKINKKIN